jgi:hypothetical protein
LTASIKELSQAPLYRYLAHPVDGILSGKIDWDEKFYEELKKSNDDELEGYEKELKEVEEKAGESEVVEAMGKKAEFWARVVDKVGHYLYRCFQIDIISAATSCDPGSAGYLASSKSDSFHS